MELVACINAESVYLYVVKLKCLWQLSHGYLHIVKRAQELTIFFTDTLWNRCL